MTLCVGLAIIAFLTISAYKLVNKINKLIDEDLEYLEALDRIEKLKATRKDLQRATKQASSVSDDWKDLSFLDKAN